LRERDDFHDCRAILETEGSLKSGRGGNYIFTPLSNLLSSAKASLTKFSLSLKGREEN
jgi:hypothetical protein